MYKSYTSFNGTFSYHHLTRLNVIISENVFTPLLHCFVFITYNWIHHKLILGKYLRRWCWGFLQTLLLPDFANEELLKLKLFFVLFAFDFFGIKKNFLISNKVDEIPEVGNDKSILFWLKTIGLAVVVVKKNGSLIVSKFSLTKGLLL